MVPVNDHFLTNPDINLSFHIPPSIIPESFRMPKVSVIIPTYNRLPMLKEAVNSVLAQDFEDFELIIVDDGSTDGTTEEMKQYGGRVKLIEHSENQRGECCKKQRGPSC